MGENEGQSEPVKPRLGLFDAVSIMIGIVIGSSIFETPPIIFNNVASPAWGMGVWVIGGILSLVGALCYAELASTYPRMGGDYVYLGRAFGPWLGFLFGWAQLVVVITASIGSMAFIFGRNAATLMAEPSAALRQELEANPDAWQNKVTLLVGVVRDDPNVVAQWTTGLAIGAVVVLSLMNVLGVVLGKLVQNLLTLLKLAGLGAIIYFGFATFSAERAAHEPVDFLAGTGSPSADFGLAVLLVMYAFGGWNDMAFVASEMRNKRNIPRALIAGTALITAIYLAVNAAYILSLGWEGARSFQVPPASAILGKELGDFAARGMAVLVMVSALGAINGLIFTGSRVYSSLGRDWNLFAALGHWNQTFGSPVWALLIQAAISISMIFAVGTDSGKDTINDILTWLGNQAPWTGLGPIPWAKYYGGFQTLFAASAPVFWTFFLATGISLFALRERDRDQERPFSVPLFPLIPLTFCVACSYFLYRAISYASVLSLICWIPLAIGVPLYYLSRKPAAEETLPPPPTLPPTAQTVLLTQPPEPVPFSTQPTEELPAVPQEDVPEAPTIKLPEEFPQS